MSIQPNQKLIAANFANRHELKTKKVIRVFRTIRRSILVCVRINGNFYKSLLLHRYHDLAECSLLTAECYAE